MFCSVLTAKSHMTGTKFSLLRQRLVCMKRNDFIRGISLESLGAVLPSERATATDELAARTTSCALSPSDKEGSGPLDSVHNSVALRQDIRETKSGIQLNLKLKVTNASGEPIQNAWVKIWHCDKDGYYSRYRNNGYQGTRNNASPTYLKGVQITDANGEVEFITFFPGWYSKRVTHIHFRVYTNSVLAATSQLTFPEKAKNVVFTSGSSHTAQRVDPKSMEIDHVFSEGYTLQMATITPNVATGGYDSSLLIAVNGTDTVNAAGLAQQEPETASQFDLQQNYPNPCIDETNIPFNLASTSEVEMEIYDLSGRKVAGIKLEELPAGDHHFPLRFNSLGIAPGTYIYQLVVTNNNGVFRQCKVMTGQK